MRTPQALCDRLQPVVALHLLDVIARDVSVLIAVYFFHLVANDVQVPVLADPLLGVVQNPDVLIFLTVDENLFGAGFVFQADLVEPSAAFGAHRLDGALGLLVRQRVGNRLVGVVDASRDDRPVRIAFQKIDDDLLSDARRENSAPTFSGPELRHADPAGTVFVHVAGAIPEKLDLHPSILVYPDFFAGLTHHHGRLRALDKRASRIADRKSTRLNSSHLVISYAVFCL